ncbi:MAG: ABC transporter ATP-binding protein [Candidatus Woesearchaeota archaeon]|nr:ABC transporter ATP-binding protein [Candidatus Woesearchaeota archaeon]
MLEIKNLDAGYDKLQILRNVSIKLKKGDLTIIIGPNGSGKSTTVKSVFGLTKRFKGAVLFEGKNLNKLKTHERVRLGIGYVPQGRLVFDTLTVEENLEMGGFGLPTEEVEEKKQEMLKLFPLLETKLDQKASFLSGGQQQMLSIARALMRTPKLLLLDEPSLGLDPKTQAHIFQIVKRINTEGVTVMMVEQNAHQALAICKKAFVIENGRVALSGGPSLAKKKSVQKLYLGG